MTFNISGYSTQKKRALTVCESGYTMETCSTTDTWWHMTWFFYEGCQAENSELSLFLIHSFVFPHSISIFTPTAHLYLKHTYTHSPATPGGFAVHTQACSCSGGPCPLSCPRLPATHEDPEGGNDNTSRVWVTKVVTGDLISAGKQWLACQNPVCFVILWLSWEKSHLNTV